MSVPEKYAELFATEAREYVAEIGRAIVTLESHPQDRDSLSAIFRAVHTLKGMAGTMGYDVVTRLSHSMESALEPLRSGARATDPGTIDLLLHAADLLEESVEASVAGRAGPDVDAMVEALEESARASTRPAQTASTSRSATARRGPPRAGVTRVRVDIRRLDSMLNLVGELVIARSQIEALASELGSEKLIDAVDRAGRLISELQAEVIESRMVPVWQVFDRFPRVVRDIARGLDKEVELVMSGKDLELDRSLLDAISDPLIHLLRNAVDHGIEPADERERSGKPRVGRLELTAERDRSQVRISVRDDGRGIDRERVLARCRELGLVEDGAELGDRELFRLIARPGFSTSSRVTTVSGRGVGLNVVEERVRGIGGSVELSTEAGLGTTFRLQLPLTLAIVRALFVEVAGAEYALPTAFARASFRADESAVRRANEREWIAWRDRFIPLTRLARLFGLEPAGDGGRRRPHASGTLHLVALEVGGKHLAVSVDGFIEEREVVVKSFDMPRGALRVFSGATIQPDGRPALILDVGRLL